MSEAVCAPMAQGFSANARLRGGSLRLSVTPSAVSVRPQSVSMCTGEGVKTCG